MTISRLLIRYMLKKIEYLGNSMRVTIR